MPRYITAGDVRDGLRPPSDGGRCSRSRPRKPTWSIALSSGPRTDQNSVCLSSFAPQWL